MKLIDKRTAVEIQAARLNPIPDLRDCYEGTNVTYTLPRCPQHQDNAVCARPQDHLPNSPIPDTGAFGLRRGKDGAFRFKPYPKTRFTPGETPERTRENIGAAAALGLSYWSEAGHRNCIWAVDEHQKAHLLELTRKTNRVYHVCYQRFYGQDAGRCKARLDAETYTIPISVQTNIEDTPEEEEMPTPTPISDKTSKARHEARSLKSGSSIHGPGKKREDRQAAKAKPTPGANEPKPMSRAVARSILLHDPEYLDDITSPALVDLLDDETVKKHHAAIRRELKNSRGLTPARKGSTK